MKTAYVKGVKVARRFADRSGLLTLLEKSNKRNALWFRSLFGIYDSADLVHLDLPWWTFSAIDAVENFLAELQGQARVYEFGSGASTAWLAKRCASVNTVEHDAPFAHAMSNIYASYNNVSLRVVEPTPATSTSKARSKRKGYTNNAFDDYVATIDQVEGTFNLIIIDGRARVACLEKSIGRLAPNGMILFDNSNRTEYRAAIESSGLHERIVRGLAPALPIPSQTSLLIRGA